MRPHLILLVFMLLPLVVKAGSKQICLDGIGQLSLNLIDNQIYDTKSKSYQNEIAKRLNAQMVKIDHASLELLTDMVLYKPQNESFVVLPMHFSVAKDFQEAFLQELKSRKLLSSPAMRHPQQPDLVTFVVPMNTTQLSLLKKMHALKVQSIFIERSIYDGSLPPVFAILKKIKSKANKDVTATIQNFVNKKLDLKSLTLRLELSGTFYKEFIGLSLASRIPTSSYVIKLLGENIVEIELTHQNYYLILLRILTSPLVKGISLI